MATAWDYLATIQRKRVTVQAAVPLSGVVPGSELWQAFTGYSGSDGLPVPSPSTIT